MLFVAVFLIGILPIIIYSLVISSNLKEYFKDSKEKELLYIAVHAAPVTLHESELKYHIEKALDSGATWKEIAEVFEIVSTLGIHAITMGVPILKEAINEVEAAK